MTQNHDRNGHGPERPVSTGDTRPPAIHLPGTASLSRSGLTFPPSLSQSAWEGIGEQLAQVSNSSAWWLADWLIYGETAYSGRYRNAVARTGLDYQTLRNYAWVARRFDQGRRRENLSLAHHAEVARLSPPEQDYWLRKAEQGEWSRNRLRKEVRSSLTQRSDDRTGAVDGRPDREQPGTVSAYPPPIVPAASPQERVEDHVALEVELPAEQLDRCVQAAVSYGLTVNDWAAQVLQLASEARTGRSPRVDAAPGPVEPWPRRTGVSGAAASDGTQGDDDVVAAEAEGVAQGRKLPVG